VDFWTIKNTLLLYKGSEADVVIPEKINGYEINIIGKNAFSMNKSVKTVTVPGGVHTIEPSAFYNCKNLLSVKLPESLVELGSGIFIYCTNLQEVNISKNITEIPASMFRDCKNLDVQPLLENIVVIGEYGFNGCESITQIIIPNTVNSIGESAFGNCTNLKSVILPSSVTVIGANAFRNNSKELVLQVEENSVAEEYAKKYNLKYLYIGETNPEDIKGWGGSWAEWNEQQTPAEKPKEQINQPPVNDELLDYYSSIWSSIAQSQTNQPSSDEDFWVEWDMWHSLPEEPKEQDNSWWYEYDAWWE